MVMTQTLKFPVFPQRILFLYNLYDFTSQKLLEELENEEIPAYIREAKLEQLKRQAQQYSQMQEKGYGTYR